LNQQLQVQQQTQCGKVLSQCPKRILLACITTSVDNFTAQKANPALVPNIDVCFHPDKRFNAGNMIVPGGPMKCGKSLSKNAHHHVVTGTKSIIIESK
jgi:hypothetical protein